MTEHSTEDPEFYRQLLAEIELEDAAQRRQFKRNSIAADTQNAADYNAPSILVKTGRDFTMRKINWLWPGWLARGKLHLLAGDKGAGKSTILFDLMARITRGFKMA